MRKILIISVCILAILMALFVEIPEPEQLAETPQPVSSPSPTPYKSIKPLPEPDPITGDSVFKHVNRWRKTNGYSEYKRSEFACNVADTRLPEIKTNWSHDGFDYKRFCKDCYLGENLSKEFYSDSEAPNIVNAWVNSPSHLRNLTASYTHGCVKCSEGYCVHVFSYQ